MPESRKYTEAQKQSARKWDAANLDRISIAVPKGHKDIIKAHAEARGESVNGFINRAIDEAMERDKAAPGAAGEATEPVEGPGLHAREQKLRRILSKHGLHLKKPRKGGGYIVEGDGERSFGTFEALLSYAQELDK